MNLLDEVARREADRQRAEWGSVEGSGGVPGVKRWVGPIVADVLDILTTEGRISPPVPPGPCWHDSGITWSGETFSVRCELLAGHDGAHQAKRGGGNAVWDADAGRFDDPATPLPPTTTAAEVADVTTGGK